MNILLTNTGEFTVNIVQGRIVGIKYSKYDILIERDQSICDECLLLEEDKLFMLHKYNLKERILYLKREGASEEYIRDELSSYRID